MNSITLASTGSKKAQTNRKTHDKTKKRTNFNLVTVGLCPHDGASLLDEVATKGAGATRTCVKCAHTWYFNPRIKACKCLTCSTDKVKSVGSESLTHEITNLGDTKTLDSPHSTPYNNPVCAGVAELADAADLKF